MRNFTSLALLCFLISCSGERQFSNEDRDAVDQIRKDYVAAWLDNDRQKILSLFNEKATIVPSGLFPMQGIEQIEKYWFPDNGSTTTIHTYAVELIDLQGTDSMAYSLEKGTLNFTFTFNEFTMTKESTSHATTIYQKNKEGNWEITSRMWTSLNE
ncbi:YybH family protein [Ekhidna sp.]|uniref:YybH family protein n=1 Tax=Ekhidna sp. TaxID=2608089 RepID=UPI003BA9D6E9